MVGRRGTMQALMAMSTIATSASVGAQPYQSPQPFQAPQRTEQPGQVYQDIRSCIPSSPSGRIVVLSQYGGKGPAVPYRIQGADDIVRVTTVMGQSSDDVVLVLLGFDTTIWDVSSVRGRIRAIYASGQNPQAVAGAPAGIPMVFKDKRGADGNSPTSCPVLSYVGDGKEILDAAIVVKGMLGRHPTDLFESYSTPTFNIDAGEVRDMPTTPSAKDVRSGASIETGTMPDGEPGLRWMVEKGILKPANGRDVAQWQAMGGTIVPYSDDGRNIMGGRVPTEPMYVATRSIDRMPEGLVSAASVTLVMPEGTTYSGRQNMHGPVFRLIGIGRKVPTSGQIRSTSPMGSSFDTWALRPLAPGYRPHHVRWDPSGQVVLETPAINDDDATHRGSGHKLVREHLSGNPIVPDRQELDAFPPQTVDMTPPVVTRPVDAEGERGAERAAWILLVVVLCSIMGFLIVPRMRAVSVEDGDVEDRPVESRDGIVQDDRSLPATSASVDARLTATGDVVKDQETVLSLLRLRRSLTRFPFEDADAIRATGLDVLLSHDIPAFLNGFDAGSIEEDDLRAFFEGTTKRIERR